ncbi:MAG: mechanosensitive ion channel [Phycisphaerae bacterium]|nr:mechanosensitive ion channel [Phycisphaerae bacterium]
MIVMGQTGTSGATGGPGAGEGEPASMVSTFEKLFDPLVSWAYHNWYNVLGAAVLLFLAWVLSRWVRRAVLRGLERARFDRTLAKFFANTLRWMVLAVAVLACLGTFGVNVTSFAAVLGAVGLAIGLGFQGSLSNLAAGVLLLVFRPFKIGDSVVVGGQTGVVDGIDLFTTNLDTPDGRRVIMPNSAIFGSTIENTTHHPVRRTMVQVTVSGAADIGEVRAMFQGLVERVTREAPGAKREPAPTAVMTDMAGGLVWQLSVWGEGAALGAIRERLIELTRDAIVEMKAGVPRQVMEVVMVEETKRRRDEESK